MNLPVEVSERLSKVFPGMKIKDFFVREKDDESTFSIEGIYKKFITLTPEEKRWFIEDHEKFLKTAMKDWVLYRFNMMTDGTVKVTYKRKAGLRK